MKYVIYNGGFLGDILFSSSVAERLKAQDRTIEVYYAIEFIQPSELLLNNPYIDGVFVLSQENVRRDFDNFVRLHNPKIITMPLIHQNEPATIQYQRAAGISQTKLAFDTYTIPHYDEQAIKLMEVYRKSGKKIIGWQRNWEYKAYQCTPESLRDRIGAPHRNIDAIIEDLSEDYWMISLGYDRNISNNHPTAANAQDYSRTASIIKYCDFVIGSEGGITNLAASVRTPTIITTDFIIQNYGPNGHVRQYLFPQMGPKVYYPDDKHFELDPCIADADIANAIREIVER